MGWDCDYCGSTEGSVERHEQANKDFEAQHQEIMGLRRQLIAANDKIYTLMERIAELTVQVVDAKP